MEETIKELTALFRDVLDNDNIELNGKTTAADIEEWDSLSHIILIAEVEKKFKLKFTSSEITKFKDVADLASAILSKKNV